MSVQAGSSVRLSSLFRVSWSHVAEFPLFASRRPLYFYLGAVVGPTLVVLTLGVLAVVRQHDAMEALHETTRRLREARLAEEVEREVWAAAASMLGDPLAARLAASVASADQTGLDEVRRAAKEMTRRHRIAGQLFVMCPNGATFPLIDPPLPRALDEWVAAEPIASRRIVSAALDQAAALEAAGRSGLAGDHYEHARRVATTAAVAALALAGLARSAAAAGDLEQARRAWEELAHDHGGTYSAAGRPYALVAALELQSLGHPASGVVAEVADALERASWTLTPEQADYFLERLGRPASRAATPLSIEAGVARALRRWWQAPVSPGQLQAAWLGPKEDGWQTFQQSAADGVTRGVAVNAAWVRETLLPLVAARTIPGGRAHLVAATTDGAPFARVFPGWRTTLAPAATTGGWTGDLYAFVAAIGTVLGLLVLGVVLLLRDVSRQAALNRLRADLVSGVSHELKAPLSVIRVYAETLIDAAEAAPADRAHFAEAILQEADRLHRVIDDVVDFSRIEQGQRSYQRVPTPMTTLLDRVAGGFNEYATLHGFRVQATVPPDLPAVTVDPLAVEQAVHNLLDNACKYSGEAREIELHVGRGDTHLTIEVRDHGVGIAPEEQARIFERFHRGRHDDRGGYGLGLYLVRHVMDAHGGRVEVESAPGAGSRFRLCFPLEDAHAQAAAHRG
jgi:signal transduction histidine kinase